MSIDNAVNALVDVAVLGIALKMVDNTMNTQKPRKSKQSDSLFSMDLPSPKRKPINLNNLYDL